MTYDLSILMPAKRVDRWAKLYESISNSFSGTWELVIITAHELPAELQDKTNIKVINSHRSPLHKQQIGLTRAEGRYITCISDDTLYEPGFLDKSFELLKGKDYKYFLVLKYLEGERFEYPEWYLKERPLYKTNWDFMSSDEYYYIKMHNSSSMKYVPAHALMLSNAIMSRQLLLELGGWDCQWHSVPMANNDLAIRFIKYGCTGYIQPGISQKCGYMHAGTGDHSALHLVEVEHDEPLFKKIYESYELSKDRLKIDIDNWKNTEEIWTWRSGLEFLRRNFNREIRQGFLRVKDDYFNLLMRMEIEKKPRKPRVKKPYQISVLVPSIHPDKLMGLYSSIGRAFSGTWEMIVIGPNGMTDELEKKENVYYIFDEGTPIRCQQRGLVEAYGDYVTWASDDGIFLPRSLDIAYETLTSDESIYEKVVVGKYIEGMNICGQMNDNSYYFLDYHKSINLPYIRNGIIMLNVGLLSRELLLEVGGWDCQFEVCPLAYNDLAIRLQNYGISFDIQQELMFICTHTPVHQGDHGPVHDAQMEHDHPLFDDIYSRKDSAERVHIPLNNWEQAEKVWQRRLKNKRKMGNMQWTKLSSTPQYELRALEEICEQVEGNTFVDLGCFIGGFTSCLATVAKKRDGKVYSIDLFKQSFNPKDFWQEHQNHDVRGIFTKNMESLGLMDCIKVIEGFSTEVAKQFDDESVDLVYIDADHSYDAVTEDIKAWYPKVKIGGIIAGHDYNVEGEVKPAVDDFFGTVEFKRDSDLTNGIWYYKKQISEKIDANLEGGFECCKL